MDRLFLSQLTHYQWIIFLSAQAPSRAAALSLTSGNPAPAAASIKALIFLLHAEKKLVRSSLLVLDIHEACIKANVLKQHITPLKPLPQCSASTKYLTQTPKNKQTNN
jgi:hypothetical protein